MNKIETNCRHDTITGKIKKWKKHIQGVETIKKNIEASNLVDVVASLLEEIRPNVYYLSHNQYGTIDLSKEGDIVLVPKYFTQYAFIVGSRTRGGYSSCKYTIDMSVEKFTFSFPVRYSDSQYGIGRMDYRSFCGSGRQFLKVIEELHLTHIFADGYYSFQKKENGEEATCSLQRIESWRTVLLEDYGTRLVKKYLDSWLIVKAVKQATQATSDKNYDMDCHSDHIQSVIDRIEDTEYRERMRGENTD
jgi:hypothetical protein